MKKLNLVILLLLAFVSTKLKAQNDHPILKYQMAMPRDGNNAASPVAWTFTAEKVSAHNALIALTATIKPGYHIYSQKLNSGGPVKTTITFQPSKEYTFVGKVSEPKAIIAEDKTFKMQVAYFKDKVVFKQKVHFDGKGFLAKGTIEYMTGDDNKNMPPFTTPILVGIDFSSNSGVLKPQKNTVKSKKMF